MYKVVYCITPKLYGKKTLIERPKLIDNGRRGIAPIFLKM